MAMVMIDRILRRRIGFSLGEAVERPQRARGIVLGEFAG